jgi:hypothetical protein
MNEERNTLILLSCLFVVVLIIIKLAVLIFAWPGFGFIGLFEIMVIIGVVLLGASIVGIWKMKKWGIILMIITAVLMEIGFYSDSYFRDIGSLVYSLIFIAIAATLGILGLPSKSRDES